MHCKVPKRKKNLLILLKDVTGKYVFTFDMYVHFKKIIFKLSEKEV